MLERPSVLIVSCSWIFYLTHCCVLGKLVVVWPLSQIIWMWCWWWWSQFVVRVIDNRVEEANFSNDNNVVCWRAGIFCILIPPLLQNSHQLGRHKKVEKWVSVNVMPRTSFSDTRWIDVTLAIDLWFLDNLGLRITLLLSKCKKQLRT